VRTKKGCQSGKSILQIGHAREARIPHLAQIDKSVSAFVAAGVSERLARIVNAFATLPDRFHWPKKPPMGSHGVKKQSEYFGAFYVHA
jgi:hypothetical protein